VSESDAACVSPDPAQAKARYSFMGKFDETIDGACLAEYYGHGKLCITDEVRPVGASDMR
jgi:hypothetical protein